MSLKLYLSGEIHTDWREQIIKGAAGLDVHLREYAYVRGFRDCATFVS